MENQQAKKPYLMDFQTIGSPAEGYISISEFQHQLPFQPQRIFWTYYTPHNVIRGRHAHHATEMILIPVTGKIELHTECLDGEKSIFVLENPSSGVFIPPLCWHTMQYSHNAVQLILASTPYQPDDYIRDYAVFEALKQAF